MVVNVVVVGLNDDEPGEVPIRAVGVCVRAELPVGRFNLSDGPLAVTGVGKARVVVVGVVGAADTCATLPGRAVVDALAIESVVGFVGRVCALPAGGLKGVLLARGTVASATERGTFEGIILLVECCV